MKTPDFGVSLSIMYNQKESFSIIKKGREEKNIF